jgi:hypothetical protein
VGQQDAPPQWVPDGVPDADRDPDSASTVGLNYFNYFTEVEDEFVRRRGKHLLVSPMDWALVESWKDAGIPLTVVIRGISRAFDAFDARPAKYRKINSILYCEQAVEETYAEYQLARVGASPEEECPAGSVPQDKTPRRSKPQTSSFTAEALLEFLERCEEQLDGTHQWLTGQGLAEPELTKPNRTGPKETPLHMTEPGLTEPGLTSDDKRPSAGRNEAVWAIHRVRNRLAEIKDSIAAAPAVDAEAIEVDLCALDNMLFESLKIAYGADTMQSLRQEAEIQLKGYKSKMDEAMYERTLDNFVGKRLRTNCRIPRLSLFYM